MERAEIGRSFEDKSASENLRKSADTASKVEALGQLSEGMESVDGKVAETLGEDKSKLGDSKPGSATYGQKIDPAAIKAQLLKNLPDQKVMMLQVSKEIHKEIKYLHKKAMKMMRTPGDVNYFEMSNLMKKLREMKGILSELFKASFETLKTLWLRFVHGLL
ncbi:hypothetical protein HY604_04605 [Candidatus Peregrinibacteria bacterium]|nr:hypothetical protein [Candidatus Peregrinibacteria bacterium]